MNYEWAKAQMKNRAKSFFGYIQKDGFSLYNSFIDVYILPKIKVVLTQIDSLILIVLYSSEADFYYLGPYLLNLISSIKFICHSKEITSKIIKENYLDINTIICDLIGFFNGFTRTLSQDYNCYLGFDVIYNERCFLHLRKLNKGSLLVMCREHSGSNDYFQLKSLAQIKPKRRDIIQRNVEEEDDKIEIKNISIFNFMKNKINEKRKNYLKIGDISNQRKSNYIYNEEFNNNIHIIDNSIVADNLDLPSESQILDLDNENNDIDKEQILEVFDFINNAIHPNDENKITKRNKSNSKKKKHNSLSRSYNEKKQKMLIEDNNTHEKIIKHQKSNDLKMSNYNNFDSEENNKNYFKNKTMNFDKNITLKNMELIKNIDFDDLNNNEADNMEININNLYYENIIKNSSNNNLNLNNNNYFDEEISQIFSNNNNSNLPKNINDNNYENVFIDDSFEKNNILPYNISDNKENDDKMNNSNLFYPTSNINNDYNNNSSNQINYKNNYQSHNPYISQPKENNNIFNNMNLKQFSQNNLSILREYSKRDDFNEDIIKINSSNPEIYSELKEKICYDLSLSQNFKLLNITSKGYIGINIRPPNIINNKKFYINFYNEKWNEHNYFIDKEINEKIEQLTEMIYKINLQKQKSAIKLITYLINKNIIIGWKIIQPKLMINNNIFIYIFEYFNDIYKHVKSIEIIIEYKNNFHMVNMISSDGKIILNKNDKTKVIYNNYINEGRIIFPINNISFFIKKINIQIILKNIIFSDMNFKISYSNSTNQPQENLPCRIVSLLSFQFE